MCVVMPMGCVVMPHDAWGCVGLCGDVYGVFRYAYGYVRMFMRCVGMR